MLNFFAIVLIIFIGLLILFFKNRKLDFVIDKKNHILIRLKDLEKIKINFSYKHDEKKFSVFYKNSHRNKMFTLFQGNTEDKLKALNIAEVLADKSILPILQKGLRDISPEVIKISAFLISKFK